MVLSAVLLAASLIPQGSPLVCPITHEVVASDSKVTEFNGMRFTYCCPGCDTTFAGDPGKALKQAVQSGKTIGVFLFDPVSKIHIEPGKTKGGSEDYKGVRYSFESDADKVLFDKDPASYTKLPKKEALFCPVTNQVVESYAKSSGYADFDGVRYYFCCPDCAKPFGDDPSKYVSSAVDHIQKPVARTTTAPL
jgi:YHS domain-containing protein